MNTLGIRVEPTKTNFVIIEDNGDDFYTIKNSECIKVPAALDFPEQLKYIRNTVLDILIEYQINVAGIRVTEMNSQNLDITRLHIEGVIQEAFASSNIENYFTGRKNSIASRVGVSVKDLGEIIKNELHFNKVTNWDILKTNNAREAALVAIGATK